MMNNLSEHIQKLHEKPSLTLPKIGSWQPAAHSFSEQQYDALEAALMAKRPLLVRGEPGLGKSQLARAVAAAWHWRLVTAVIHSRSEVEDLLYQVDHVARLSDANSGDAEQDLDKYIRRGPIWQAMQRDEDHPVGMPEGADAYVIAPGAGCVLLIDEIDKAHSDVPNALLEMLNSGEFWVPETKTTVKPETDLFVVITANDERRLPAAFLRRCAVLDLSLGDDPKATLTDIAQSTIALDRCPAGASPYVEAVVDYLLSYRQSVPAGDYRPGTSELLDMLRVLGERSDDLAPDEMHGAIARMGQYLVQKEFVQDEQG